MRNHQSDGLLGLQHRRRSYHLSNNFLPGRHRLAGGVHPGLRRRGKPGSAEVGRRRPAGETFTGGLTSGSKTVTRSSGTFSTSEIGAQITDTTHSSYIPSGTTITAVNGSSATMSANATTTDSSETLAIHAEATATPGVPITATNANYHSCTAPCTRPPCCRAPTTRSHRRFTTTTIGSDTLYVGDDLGNLHQFTGVFNGTPGENVGGGWPVGLGSNKLSSPVYDGSTYVLVGDMGGSLYSVKAATAAFTTASGLGDAIADAPLLNGTAGTAFAFVTTSGTYSESGENAIYGFATAFANWSPSNVSEYPGVVALGTGGAGYYLYAGASTTCTTSHRAVRGIYTSSAIQARWAERRCTRPASLAMHYPVLLLQ